MSRRLIGIAAVGTAAIVLVGGAAVLLASAAPTPAVAAPRFVEEAAAAGIEQVYDGDFEFFVGGGVAAFDCNDDGRPELYLAGGARSAALYRNDTPIGGALRFTALPDPATDLDAVTGAYPIDVDGDGRTDLVVLRLGENVILRGLGDCRFERANASLGFDGGDSWTVGFSATWEGEAASPTLAFGNYLELDATGEWTGSCADNELIRPKAEGPMYGNPTTLTPGWCTLSILFSDWSRTGRRDLRMTNDQHYSQDGQEQLWRVALGEEPALYTADDGWRRMRIWGMGIASHDLTGDGLPEVFLTSQGDNKLQALVEGPGRPTYADIAVERGATAHRPYAGDTSLPSTAWHAEFQDVNNDTFIDLFVAKGNVESMADYAAKDPSNLLLGKADGTFVEGAEAAGVVSFAKARGAALVDLNLDGLLDLVVVNRREPVAVWRSVGSGTPEAPAPLGRWLGVRLDDPDRPNRDAIGAWVAVAAGGRTVEREVTIGGGHAGGQLGWIHFGLGATERAEVRVTWPDGAVGPWLPVTADGFVTVRRGATEVEPWQPGATTP
ncbi:MAG TPA: CRTAC1 family protein [Candidatus Limnocylindrales bacterium]|nr:CRTAC1 family protein [Candidatus Limnocylindrales bacterium]